MVRNTTIALAIFLGVSAGAAAQTKPTPPESYTATTAKNMTPGAGAKLLIQILRWSSDDDRGKVLSVVGGGGAPKQEAPPAAPVDSAKALEDVPTAGYIWTEGTLGYALKYAHRVTLPDGGQRMVFVTDRPLGSWERPAWKASGQGAPDSPYTVVELRLNAKGRGEGKLSLSAPTAIDQQTKTIGLANYETAPVLLQDVQRMPQGYSR